MKIIFSVFAIVDNSGFRLFQARQNTSCAHCEILQGVNLFELADKIKEKAKEIEGGIGINFQRPIKVLITQKGEVSDESYDRLEGKERRDFLSRLRKR